MARYNYEKYLGRDEREREEENRIGGRYNYEKYLAPPEPVQERVTPSAVAEPTAERRSGTYTASTGAVITPEVIRSRGEEYTSLSPREQRRAQREVQDPENPFLDFLKDVTVDPLAEALDFLLYETAPGRFLTRTSQGAASFSGAPVRPEQQVSTGSRAGDVVADVLGSIGAVAANPANAGQSFVGAAYNNPLTRYLAAQAGSRFSSPLASRVASEATREGIAGAVEGATTSAMRGEDTRGVLQETALGGLLGGGGGALIGGVLEPAARRGIEAAREAADRRRAGQELLELIETAPLDTTPPQTRAVARADVPVTPERARAELAAETFQRREAPTLARRGRAENVYRQKYDQLIEEAQRLQNAGQMPPGREWETLENLWSRMAGPEDPGLDELIDLAFSSRRRTIPDDLVQRARARQSAMEAAGIDTPIQRGRKGELERLPARRTEAPPAGPAAAAMDTRVNRLASAETPSTAATGTVPGAPRAAGAAGAVPEGVQAMRAAPIPLRAPDPFAADVKPITRKEMIDNIRKRFGVTIRTGRLGNVPRGTLGIHKIRPEVIRSRYANDIQIISHELGHNLDKRYGLKQEAFAPELENLVRQAGVVNLDSYTPDQILDEGVAEFLRLYLTDPVQAQRLAPRYSRFFETRAAEILPDLQATREDVARWIDQGEALQFEGQINRTGRDTTRTNRERLQKMYSSAIDRFYQLAVAEKDITGKLDDASKSLYKKARLSVGAPAKAQLVLEGLQGILQQLDGTGWTVKDLGNYAAARHALDLENLGIESGFTREQIEATLRKYQSPEMEAIQQQLVEYNNRLLDMLVEGQILRPDAVAAMREKYPNYVPFYRFFDEDMNAVGFGKGGKGFTDLSNPIKRMKGSTRDIIDPLESMIRNTFAVVNAVEKNKVGLELARLANMEGAGRWVERLEGAASVPRENIVTVFENGNRVQYQLEPELFRAMKQLDEESSSMIVRILSTPASWLRAGATLTPEFMVRNPIRDQFQAFVVSEFGYNPIVDLPRGMFHVLRKRLTGVDEMYDAWVRSGGAYGNFVSLDRNYLRDQLRQLRDERNPWVRRTVAIVNPREWINLLRTLSEISEESTKVGEFARGLRRGATPEEAAFQSRDLMDFGRAGSNMKQANQMISFLNSTVQGKDRIARAFINDPMRTTMRAMTAVTLPTVAFYMWNRFNANETQRETLDNAPQWMKDTFFLIAIPGTDVVARIPKPFDLSPVFSSIPENIMRWMDDNDPQSMEEFAETLGRDWSLPVMFTALTPWIENMTNYSFFTGGPVIPRRDQDLLPEDQYGPSTSLTAQLIGRATDYSPYLIDNLIRGYGAGLGRYATEGLDEILQFLGAGQLPPEPARRPSESPLLSPFTVSNTGGGQVMDDFYELLDELSRKDQSNKRNRVRDPFVASAAKQLRSSSSKIGDLRKRYREIQSDMDMSPEEKREQLDRLNAQMRRIARQTIERVEQRREQSEAR